jgi:hypothetical protein
LHVIGNIRINGGDILNWGGQAFIQTIGANDMFFRPNSTLRMILTAAGNLGLGNGFTSPAYLLDVSGSSRHGYQASDTHQFTGSVSISGSLNATASWANNALTASSLVVANSYTITNLTASNIRASATGSFGMVGIGTTIPGAPLDILANDLADGILIRGNDNGNCKIRIVNSGVGGEQFSLTVGYPGASNGSFVIRSITNSSNRYVIGETGAHIWATNAGDAMTLNISGSLGIGTTNPVAKLQVAGNISGSSFTSSISNAVGFLGTASWAQNVVSASFATTAQTANALNASNTYTIAGLTSAYVDVNGSGTIPTTGIYRPSTKTLGLSADGTLIFKISNVSAPATSSIETGNFIVQTGNVGIGSSSPSSKFEVLTSAVGLANQPNIIGNFRGDTDGRSLIRVDNTSTSAGAAAANAAARAAAWPRPVLSRSGCRLNPCAACCSARQASASEPGGAEPSSCSGRGAVGLCGSVEDFNCVARGIARALAHPAAELQHAFQREQAQCWQPLEVVRQCGEWQQEQREIAESLRDASRSAAAVGNTAAALLNRQQANSADNAEASATTSTAKA